MTTIILIRKHLLTELLNTKPIKIGCEHVGCESERGEHEWARTDLDSDYVPVRNIQAFLRYLFIQFR